MTGAGTDVSRDDTITAPMLSCQDYFRVRSCQWQGSTGGTTTGRRVILLERGLERPAFRGRSPYTHQSFVLPVNVAHKSPSAVFATGGQCQSAL